MPSNSRLFVKPFIGGLNTELSNVEDAILNTSDELNCTILPEGIRGRRLGFNIERDGVWTKREPTTSYSGFYWKNVGNLGIDMVVQQVNKTLYFYDARLKPFSVTDKNETYIPDMIEENEDKGYYGECHLDEYVENDVNGIIEPLRYALGSGYLFVVGNSIKPLKIEYKTGTFIVTPYSLSIRDLTGIDDGLEVDEMPHANSETVDNFGDLDIKHFYNLLNQGWREDEIIQFATDRSKWPSNNLQWFVGKDDSGAYNTEKLLQTYFGNTPAPKGHFILDYSTISRADASGLYGVEPTVWGFVGDAASYVRSRSIRVRRQLKVVTKTATLKEERVLKRLIFKWTRLRRKSAKKSYDDKWSGEITYEILGYNTVTGEYETITTESEVAYGAAPTEVYTVTIPMIDNDRAYKQYQIKVTFDEDSNGTSDIPYPLRAEGSIYTYYEGDKEIDDFITETHRGSRTVKDIAYMSERLFYLVNDTVLFSQAIKETGDEYSKCYQDADPTSEEISDVIPTDGGYVKFNNLGEGRCIESFNRGILVFGSNIVYGLISPLDKIFTATEYDVVELSRAGIIGDRSAVSTDNMVYYWSPLGIFRVGVNLQTGSSMVAETITHTTIQEWYDRIPNESKETCRGCFDYVNNRIYWYYSLFDEEDDEENSHKLNRCLVYDLTYNAFMPFKIEGNSFIADVFSSPTSYEVAPTLYLRVNGNRVISNEQPVIAAEEDEEFKRWTSIQHLTVNTEGSTSFGDYNSREFKDFDTHGYDSYMVSRPIMFAGFSAFGNAIQDTASDKQVPILQTLFKRTEKSPLLNNKVYDRRIDVTKLVKNTNKYSDADWEWKGYIGGNGEKYDTIYIQMDRALLNPVPNSMRLEIYADGGTGAQIILDRFVWDGNSIFKRIDLPRGTIADNGGLLILLEVWNGGEISQPEIDLNVKSYGDKYVPDVYKYVAESSANIRMRWGWSLNDRSNRWDMVQNGYRPQKDFLHDEYVESRIHVRGRGKAFQVEIRNDDNKDFRLAGMNLVVRSK